MKSNLAKQIKEQIWDNIFYKTSDMWNKIQMHWTTIGMGQLPRRNLNTIVTQVKDPIETYLRTYKL